MQNMNWRTRRPPCFHFSNYSTATYVGYTAEELQFKRNPVIDVAADFLAAPRRNFEADSAAPWQRAPPLDHVQVAAVRGVGMSRDRRCEHHAAEMPLHDCTAIRVPNYPSVQKAKNVFIVILRRASEASLSFLGFPREKKPPRIGSYEHRVQKIKIKRSFCMYVCVIQHRNWPLRSTIFNAHGTNSSSDGLCTRTHTCLLYTSPSPRD